MTISLGTSIVHDKYIALEELFACERCGGAGQVLGDDEYKNEELIENGFNGLIEPTCPEPHFVMTSNEGNCKFYVDPRRFGNHAIVWPDGTVWALLEIEGYYMDEPLNMEVPR